MSTELRRLRGQPMETIRLGFMPLLDAAIPVIAARHGFAAAEGLDIELVRETSWANVRDRLAFGHFDAAHLLAPLPVAAALGLTPHDVPLIAPLSLGTGGNAITVSVEVWAEAVALAGTPRPDDPAQAGKALKAVIEARRARGGKPLTFAVVHPYSSHNYELRYWLAASGINPDRDVSITIITPPYMPDALASGRIDGFCVGEPWNTRAVINGDGEIIATKQAIWPQSPEKVLGLRAVWAEESPGLVAALVRAMLAAAQWCADPSNREALVATLCEPDILGVRTEDLLPALENRVIRGSGESIPLAGFLSFAGGNANRPDPAAARWYFDQMLRWGQVTRREGDLADVGASFRPDLHDAAMVMRQPGWTPGPSTRFRFFDGESTDPAEFKHA